jgi:hypothetical protein
VLSTLATLTACCARSYTYIYIYIYRLVSDRKYGGAYNIALLAQLVCFTLSLWRK